MFNERLFRNRKWIKVTVSIYYFFNPKSANWILSESWYFVRALPKSHVLSSSIKKAAIFLRTLTQAELTQPSRPPGGGEVGTQEVEAFGYVGAHGQPRDSCHLWLLHSLCLSVTWESRAVQVRNLSSGNSTPDSNLTTKLWSLFWTMGSFQLEGETRPPFSQDSEL